MNMKLYAGIDEAGRGALIGPMVICCVIMTKKGIEEIEKMGLRTKDNEILDSKRLTYIEREFFKEQIEKLAEKIITKEIPAKKIDEYVEKGFYNKLEAETILEIIHEIKKNYKNLTIIVDSPASPKKFKKELKIKKIKLIVENKADTKYSIVACSSIIAKTLRDEKIISIFKECKSIIGSGYPTKRVINYIREYISKNKEEPPWIRKSWKILKSINTS